MQMENSIQLLKQQTHLVIMFCAFYFILFFKILWTFCFCLGKRQKKIKEQKL